MATPNREKPKEEEEEDYQTILQHQWAVSYLRMGKGGQSITEDKFFNFENVVNFGLQTSINTFFAGQHFAS